MKNAAEGGIFHFDLKSNTWRGLSEDPFPHLLGGCIITPQASTSIQDLCWQRLSPTGTSELRRPAFIFSDER